MLLFVVVVGVVAIVIADGMENEIQQKNVHVEVIGGDVVQEWFEQRTLNDLTDMTKKQANPMEVLEVFVYGEVMRSISI